MRFLASLASVVRSWSCWSNRAAEVLLFVIGFSMAMLTGIQVASRYLLNHSIFWSEEVGRICLVWISFLGASAAYKRHAHIGVDFLVVRLPARVRRSLKLFVIFASLVFFLVLMVYGVAFARFVSAQKTAALGLSMALPYMVIPLSGGLFFLHGLSHLFDLLGFDAGDQ